MNQDLRIYAKGLAFKDGIYDLRTLESIISNHRKILDYLVAIKLGKRQVSQDLKSQLDYDVKINPGSIELLINFVFEHKEFIGAFAFDGGESLSKIIVSLLRDAITLREQASGLIEKGIKININISNTLNIGSRIENTNISCDESTGTIYINDPKILLAAQATRAPINGLLNKIDGKSIEFIDIDSKQEHLKLTPEQRNIVGKQKEELPITLNVIGRLDMVAFSSHRGVIVSDGERFNVTWHDEIRPKMQKIADIEGVVFRVKPIVDHKNLEGKTIGFYVIDCGNPQGQLSV